MLKAAKALQTETHNVLQKYSTKKNEILKQAEQKLKNQLSLIQKRIKEQFSIQFQQNYESPEESTLINLAEKQVAKMVQLSTKIQNGENVFQNAKQCSKIEVQIREAIKVCQNKNKQPSDILIGSNLEELVNKIDFTFFKQEEEQKDTCNISKNQQSKTLTDLMLQCYQNPEPNKFRHFAEQGGDIFAKNIQNLTTLHFAAQSGDLDGVKYLVQNGVDIEAKSDKGRTPLSQAIYYTQKEISFYLVQKGANVNAYDNQGKGPLFLAVMQWGWEDLVRLLIFQGANIHAVSSQGQSILLQAVHKGQIQSAEIILQKGGNVNNADKQGQTPLHYASYNGWTDIVQKLFKKGANLNAKNGQGYTPLNLAEISDVPESVATVKYLKSRGAK